jgi:pyruvate formate lyase activating enzyme
MNVSFGDIQNISTIDYPGEVVSVLFFCGCPFKCPFCHNFRLINPSDCEEINIDKIYEEVKKSIPFITGVCVTGGEPTQQIEQLIDLADRFKKLDLLVKIDTNGYFSKNLERICKLNIVDYFAMDVKNELKPKKYAEAAGLSSFSGKKIVNRIKESIKILLDSESIFEARTTVVKSLNDSESTIRSICQEIIGVNRYVLQGFRCMDEVLDPEYSKIPNTERSDLLPLAEIAKEYIDDVRIRTAENGEERIS